MAIQLIYGIQPSSLGSLENGVEPSPSQLSDLRKQARPHDQDGERGSVRAPDGAGSRSRGSVGQGQVCLGRGRPGLQAEGPRQVGNKARNNQCA